MNRRHFAPPAQFIVGRFIHACAGAVHLSLAAILSVGCGDPSAPGSLTPSEAGSEPSSPGTSGISATYLLKLVGEQSLPVKSPDGAGNWDYDTDAHTWQLVDATIAVKADGTYTNEVVHQAVSGRRASQSFGGTYTRTSPSTLQLHSNGSTSSATISGGRLTWNWGNGTVLSFER